MLAAALLALAPQKADAADGKTKITFLYLPVSDYGPFFVAKEKGYFDEQGLDVTLTSAGGTSKTLPQVVAGHAQASGLSWGASLFNALASGAPLAIVAGFAEVPVKGKPPAALMVSEKAYNDGLKSAQGLKGKKVAVFGPGALAAYLAHVALESGGLTLKDVNIIYLPPPAFGQAFANGSIDAGMVFEPSVSIFEKQKMARVISAENYASGVQEGLILVNADFLKQNEAAVVGLVAGYLKAARELENGGWTSPETAAVFAKYTRLTAPLLKVIGKPHYDPDGKVKMDSVRKQEKLLHEQGLLTYKGEMAAEKLFRGDIAAKAAQRVK
ncbi:MAG: ABC transporter substrate-binding protein [Rhodospirillaceae bacterium]|nr:ABC transporter substrate-binding protein [Rhodospirillaceae bacterium]